MGGTMDAPFGERSPKAREAIRGLFPGKAPSSAGLYSQACPLWEAQTARRESRMSKIVFATAGFTALRLTAP